MPAVEAQLTWQVKALKFGDPYDPATVAGPVISEREAIRIESWIAEAMAKGARRLVGGARQGAVVPPTLLAYINPATQVGRCELFGPVVCLLPFAPHDEASGRVTVTPFGPRTGILPPRIHASHAPPRRLRVCARTVSTTPRGSVDAFT